MINFDSQYRLIYTSIAFAKNLTFLRRLRDQYQVEIPFLDADDISEDIKAAFDTYLYIEESPTADTTYNKLVKSYGQITFLLLGTVPGTDIKKMMDSSRTESNSNVKLDEYYKVLSGPYKNLIVKMTSFTEPVAKVEFQLFKETKTLDIPIANLVPIAAPLDPQFDFNNLLDQAHDMSRHNAIILDGHNELYRNMFGYSNLFTRATNHFVGGAYGFYFTLLKLKELFPEYEVHVVFDGYDSVKFKENPDYKASRISNSDKFKAAFADNLAWTKEFIKAVGFNLYHFDDREADDVIGSLAHRFQKDGYEKVYIYSSDTDFMQCVSETVSIYCPKQSFRGHTTLTTPTDVYEKFGITDIRKTNWVRAIAGDFTDHIPSINIFNKDNCIDAPILNQAHYIQAINDSATLEELKTILNQVDWFAPFITSGQFDANLKLLTINKHLLTNDDLTPYGNTFNLDSVAELLERFSFYKELEMLERNARILQGIW